MAGQGDSEKPQGTSHVPRHEGHRTRAIALDGRGLKIDLCAKDGQGLNKLTKRVHPFS